MSKKTKYFLRDEVVIHNHAKDIWVIINRHVFNLTPLYADRRGSMNDVIRILMKKGIYFYKFYTHFLVLKITHTICWQRYKLFLQ